MFLLSSGSRSSSIINIGIQLVAGLFQVPPDIIKAQLPMVAPLPRSPAEIAQRNAVDQFLSESSASWENRLGYLCFGAESSNIVNDKMSLVEKRPSTAPAAAASTTIYHLPATYGEVTTLGARQLFYHMGMTTTNDNNNNNDAIVFVDMGSGVGKLVMQAYMEIPRVSRATGIELAPQRHQHATSAWEELKDSARDIRNVIRSPANTPLLEKEPTVEFIEGDCLEADLSETTHMYVASLCFSDDMMHSLATKLDGGSAPKLQCVATLKEFPKEFESRGVLDRQSYQIVGKTFGMIVRTEFVEMSWTVDGGGPGCEVFIYTKPPYKW